MPQFSIISEAGTCAACDELMAQHEFVLMTNQTKGTCQHLECFLNKDRPVETYVSFENLTADQLERVFAIIQPFRDEIEEKEQAKVDKAQARLEKAEAIVKKKQANAEKAAAKKKGPKASKKAAAHADSDTDTEEPVAKKKTAKKPMTPEQVRAANPYAIKFNQPYTTPKAYDHAGWAARVGPGLA